MTKPTEKRPISLEDYFKLQFITEAALSPDGKSIVYGITQYNAEKDEDRVALWLLKLDSGETRQITAGTSKDFNIDWAPDGRSIAFASTRVDPPQAFILPVDGGEARQVTHLKPGIAEGPLWSPDGKYLAFTAAKEVEPRDVNKPYRVTRNIFRFNGMGYLDDVVTGVCVIPASGGEHKHLTDDANMNAGISWSPDGQEILFQAMFHPHSFAILSDLKTVDLHGNVHEIVDKSWGEISSAAWTPDGHILFTGKETQHPLGYKTDLWQVRRRGGKPECRTQNLPGEVNGGLQDDMPVYLRGKVHVTRDSRFAILRVQKGGSIEIWEVALKGEEAHHPLVASGGAAMLADANNECLLFVGSTWNDPTNLFIADRQGKNEKQLTHLNEELIAEWLLPEVEPLHFKGADDVEIEGWLMKPASGEPPYPTVLFVHGGPTGAFGNAFSFDMSMLAGAGMAVFFNNPQGSSGYGSDFGLALNLRWGEIDYKDHMNGLDHLIAKGLVDPNRLGIFGLSYGGYMTCWAITQTERFKAAVSENPVSDLASDNGVGDASVWMNLDAMGGQPHEVPEKYREASPVTFAHRCKTPTLMLQGESDYRCPPLNTEQFYTMLKVNGCTVEMVRFPNSSHAESIVGAPIIRRAQNEELVGWMKKYLLEQDKPIGDKK